MTLIEECKALAKEWESGDILAEDEYTEGGNDQRQIDARCLRAIIAKFSLAEGKEEGRGMSGPDGPVADSSDGYKILQCEHREDEEREKGGSDVTSRDRCLGRAPEADPCGGL